MGTQTFEMTEDEFRFIQEDSGGFCICCGAEAFGIEPDAREYKCSECTQHSVYGIEELLLMGRIELIGE